MAVAAVGDVGIWDGGEMAWMFWETAGNVWEPLLEFFLC